MLPRSPRAWLRWSFLTLERYASPRTVNFDPMPPSDRRLKNSREVALSIKIALERCSNGCRGRGPRLLAALYLDEMSWQSFTPREKGIIRKTERMFKEALVQAGFVEGRE